MTIATAPRKHMRHYGMCCLIWLLLTLSLSAQANQPRQGYLDFPFLFGDGGIVALDSGATITVTWVDPPEDAIAYVFTIWTRHTSTRRIFGIDTDASDGVAVDWEVPAFIGGDGEGIAIYPDGRQVYSSAGVEVASGAAPEPGECVISSNLSQVIVFAAPMDFAGDPDPYANLERVTAMSGIAPIIGTGPDEWLLVDLNGRFMSAYPDDSLPDTAWGNPRLSGFLRGDCDDLPIVLDGYGAD